MNALLNNTTRVVKINGRWFITIGNPGFNSPANNRNGYATEEGAMAASLRYGQGR
jgi:hypothetical protein